MPYLDIIGYPYMAGARVKRSIDGIWIIFFTPMQPGRIAVNKIMIVVGKAQAY